MAPDEDTIPAFTYFPDPIRNGSIVKKNAVCSCCEKPRGYMYVGPIYAEAEINEVCPWCIADGSAAHKWSAVFNDIRDLPGSVPRDVAHEIETRTPGYVTWQGNTWLFASDDAMIFVGEIVGAELVKEGNPGKLEACMKALEEWNWDFEWSSEMLMRIVPGGEPSVYLFQNRSSGEYAAYADMT